jgi:5-methyltetrahydrofolate--homocysteine methyltransferase
MADMKAISEAVQKGKKPLVMQLVEDALKEGVSPSQIMNEGLIAGMTKVGELFSANQIAARAMNAALEKISPLLAAAGHKPKGKVVVGTVKGDLHDIGKNLVCIMVRGAGYEVVDAGVDCTAEKFVELAKKNDCKAILCSALLTTTMPYMKIVVEEVKKNNLAVKVVIGGAPVTQAYANEIGADGYGADANEAALVTQRMLCA